MEQTRHLMNYGLGENLTLSILGLLVVSATYLGMGRTDSFNPVGSFNKKIFINPMTSY